jgi:hypothetical protein
MTEVPDLTLLANSWDSDKGDQIFHAHGYAKFYSFLFEQFRMEHFSLLELGLHRGEIDPVRLLDRKLSRVPSIRMWLDFFPHIHAFGFDISDFSAISEERFSFIRGDLGNEADLKRLKASTPPVRVLIDDGSHAPYHQQFAFKHLFSHVESGGFYIIEDLHAGHPIESDLPATPRTNSVFERYMETGRLSMHCATEDENAALARQISQVFMHRSSSGGVSQWSPKMMAILKG